jgi:hypothetical protein
VPQRASRSSPARHRLRLRIQSQRYGPHFSSYSLGRGSELTRTASAFIRTKQEVHDLWTGIWALARNCACHGVAAIARSLGLPPCAIQDCKPKWHRER